MLELSQWPLADRAAIVGVLCDIDDTLTTEGQITGDALQALQSLHDAGIHVVAITGRPVGWSEPFALQWPVDAIVPENGAVALVPERSPHPNPPPVGEGESVPSPAGGGLGWGPRVRKIYVEDEELRRRNFARLQKVAQRLLADVPGAVLARDSAGRETDIAIDHSEFVQLPPACIAQVVRLMQDEGMNATVSSIHINGWFGDHNKLSGARWIVRELFGRELDEELERWVYVGDSTNDEAMFAHFPNSIGVANIRRFEAEMTHLPRYITRGERGAGFAEVAQAILPARAASA
jgi:hydroxymethylpyrimidine pyrophosphatase-like HAD family hydrolase